MEQLKVRKKDVLITNTIIYLGLSFLFLYLQYAYRHQLSPFSLVYLRKSAELFWYVAAPLLVTCYLIWKHHKWAVFAFNFSVLLVSFKVIEGLFIEFNKIIVIATFFYAVISYFLYQLMGHYLSAANINPNYTSHDLFSPLLRKITVTVLASEKGHSGHLTNWDNAGCFIRLDGPARIPSRVKVQINFEGRSFEEEGEVVAETPDFNGVGIKFENTARRLESFNWSEFTELIDELGFQPERLR
ncbi:MAG: PilZ domain-containing protein [Bacteriovoracaceae bacterium]